MVIKCAVLGCTSKDTDEGINFFPFPRVSKKYGDLKKIWIEFTRRRHRNFDNEKFCDLHFEKKCFFVKGKSDNVCLKKGSVPTIYYENGIKIEVPYNIQYQKYYGIEADKMYRETENSAFDHESELIKMRYKMLKNLKNYCRFCLTNNKAAKCIALNSLDSYQINPIEILEMIGCSIEHNSTFSDIICEDCFLKVIEFYKFSKKCQEKQKEFLAELENLDEKIQKVQRVNRTSQNETIPWFKVEITEEINENGTSVFINDEITEDLKNEQMEETISMEEEALDPSETEEFVDFPITFEDETEVIKRPLRNPPNKNGRRENFNERQYECFFCRLKFKGRTVYKKHDCTVKERECPVPGCGKMFSNQGSYSGHITRIHGMPRVSRQFCPGCRIYFQMSAFDFKEHCRTCEQTSAIKNEIIKCELCKKECDGLEAYTAHKLFHATEKLIERVDENGVTTYAQPKYDKDEKICDICGKVLTNYKNLRKHKVNVHLVDFTGEMYYCDLCPVKKPTRRLIYDHMKSVHIINWHTCSICGKSFKSRRLLARHNLYMHERHRLNIRCQICPHKPGFSATIYLEQHMKKNHGDNSTRSLNRFKCDFGFCDATYAKQSSLEQHKIKMHGYYQI
ncbi:hypothetical protein PVAND_015626 [Polypedilum vanderplanki]|uniref:Zinc finger protein n=1 Tax=Polypedilum vanderplanki TaxID=319348 RepID=A0A9J6BCT7_POLVA|nr:hypothetical protein PVAND_015626 [Polypedilum vanderplanki]